MPSLLPIPKKTISLLTLIASTIFLAPTVVAQSQIMPDLQDRTGDMLTGLANDDSAKIVELGDFNNDGAEDLIISRTDAAPVLLMNTGNGLNNETALAQTMAAGANDALFVEAFDADGDGWTDLIFGRRDIEPILFTNLANNATGVWQGFDNGTIIAGTSNNLVLGAGDVNGDGALDLFAIKVESGTNDLLINDGTGNFTEQSNRLGGLGELTRGHSALLADVEGDGDVDIVYIESDLFLHIYYNDGNANFDDAQRSTFRNPDNFAYIYGAGDFNGDGIFDYRQYSNPEPRAEMSDGTFDSNGLPNYTIRTDANMLRGNRKHGTVHVRDIDGDGDLDYVLSSMLRNFGSVRITTEGMRTEMVLNTGINSGEFVTFVGDDWGKEESYDMKILDIDGDGNMDMFVAHQFRYGVYINNPPEADLAIAEQTSAPATERGTPVSLSVLMESGTATNFNWDFGDGNTANGTTSSVLHTYTDPGRYQVTVTASNATSSDQITFFQRVHEPLQPNQAMSSMDMAYEFRLPNHRVYIANPDNDSISVIDAQSGALLNEIAVGDEPRSIALGGENEVYVVNKAAATISVIDKNALTVTDTISLPRASRPHGIVIERVTQTAYIALEAAGQIVKMALPSGQMQGVPNVGPTPRELALSADGTTLYAPRFITLPVDGESTRIPTQNGGDLMQIDTTLMTQSMPINIAFNSPLNNIDTEVNARGIPNYLRAPAISPDGLRAALPMKLDNIYRGSMRDGQARTHDMLVRGALAHIDLLSGTELLNNRFQFDNNSQPTAVAFGPTGNYLFVVHEASRGFEVIDVHSNEIIFSDSLGFAPTGVIVSPDGTRVFVHNWLDRSVNVIDSSALMAGTSSNADTIAVTELVTNEALDEQTLAGKILFHDSSDLRLAAQKYISCASCHDEAGHDGRTWDFSDAGEGLRNTIDLRGRAGVGNGNVHWSANFNEIHDFENDIREIFDGVGLLSDTDFAQSSAPLDDDTPKAGRSTSLDALAAYAATLSSFGDSPYRADNGSLTASGARGKTVFDNASCATCHGGDHFTDSVQALTHNIGTIDQDTGGRLGMPLLNGGLDTPTLRGLWYGAPYLHDGEALTLQDAVLAHTVGMSVDPASLTTAELDDLADYLLQIDDSEPAPQTPNEPTDPSNPTAASTLASINIDGNLTDWPAAALVASDPDDVTGAQNTLDFASVWMAHDGNNFYVQYENHQPDNAIVTWGYGIYIDVNGSEGYTGFNAEMPIGIDYMVEANVLFRYTGTGTDWSWDAVSNLSLELSGASAELAIKRTDLEDATAINVFFYANNESVQGSARDYVPNAAADPTAAADLRVIAYNFGGKADPTPSAAQPIQVITNTVANTQINIDGDISDWSSLTSFGDDPVDVFGSTNHIDWREGWMAHSGSDFYIAWENKLLTQNTWGNGIMLDTDSNASTGFIGFASELPIGVDYLIEGDSLFRYTGNGTDWSWGSANKFEFAAAGNFAELKIPASMLGNPTQMRLFFNGDNASIGGTAIDFYPDTVSNSQLNNDLRAHWYNTTAQPPISNQNFTPVIDGTLSEWRSDLQVGSDDAPEANTINSIDWHQAFVAHNNNSVFLAYTTHQPIDLNWGYSVFIDSDTQSNTGFKGFGGELPLGADFLIEGGALYEYSGTSQSEWNWTATAGIVANSIGNSLEMSISLATLGNPAAIDFILYGNNSAVSGNRIDLLPDTGAHNYNLNTQATQREEPALPLQASLDDPLGNAAKNANADALNLQDDVGTGSLAQWTLAWLVLLFGIRQRKPLTRSINKSQLLGLSIIFTSLLSACGSDTFEDSNAVTDNGGQNLPSQTGNPLSETNNQPNNRPGFNDPVELGAALPDSQPNNDVSLSIGVQADLSGIEVVPAVATNAGGSVRISFDKTSGILRGQLQHTADQAVSAAIYRAPVGQNGQLIVTLLPVDDDNYVFEIPAGTALNANQQAQFEQNLFYVVVHTIDQPYGELRAQLQTEALSIEYLPTLNDLQAKVFSPRCATCHIGGGANLPSSMDLSDAQATYASLVGRASLEVDAMDRVTAGMADQSYLVHKIEGTQQVGSRMPFRGEPLSDEAIAAIREWIDQGALP